jgi:cell division protein FtsI/penicillin-binding protein 2
LKTQKIVPFVAKRLQNKRQLLMLWGVLLLVACTSKATPVPPTQTSTLPPPQSYTTSVPSAETAARGFLDGWNTFDTAAMYALLSSDSQSTITEDAFKKRYDNVANEAALSGVDYKITSRQISPNQAEIGYQAVLHSGVIGDISRDMNMSLKMEQGRWRVDWNDGMILPELANGNTLGLDRASSTRATIFDRNGQPLAAQTDAAAIGVWPDYVDLGAAKGLLSLLMTLTPYRSDTIISLIRNAQPGAYIALGEVPVDQNPRQLDLLSTWGSAVVSRYSRRLYYGNGIAPHLVGYVSAIQQDELDKYRRLGYRSDDRIGRKGLELWGEQTLNGTRGGTLYVFTADGKPVAELGSAPTVAGQDIYTTVDRDFQAQAQKAMSVFNGAAVVMERDTGRVLAMVSSPGFDPNAYEIENYNWQTLLSQVANDPNLPQFNRATQGQYPLGSVFKIITMAAALESGRFTQDSTYQCEYEFNELPGFTRYDWTWDHFQKDGTTQPSGLLTLPQGLIRSCNPYFWHIGLDLYNAGLTKAIANMARGFGLGSKTGIVGLDEEAGTIPEPASDVDAINLAIGQGDTQVTPLQVARFIAAVGNGGTLYRPQVIEKIVSPDGTVTSQFKPEIQGTLPVKPATLQIIQDAMKGVIKSERPRGTAWLPLSDMDIPMAGKTGTATSASGLPHAWFAGYTFAGKEGKPDIAIAVLAENAGEGSEIAAPIFRRLVELYFYGKPLRVYRWEATFDVTRSPTPEVTWTPTSQPGVNP